MNNNNDGRPSLYTQDELLKKLMEYQKKYPNQKIKYSKLEKETGVKRHIWQYSMKDTIEAINKKVSGADIPERAGYTLPSVQEMVITIEKDPQMLEICLQTLLDMVRDLLKYKESKKTIDILENDYEEEIKKLNLEIAELKRLLNNQQDIINKFILDSAAKKQRAKQSIKDNIIEFNNVNLEQYNEMFKELMK